MDAPIEVLLQHWPGVLFRQATDLRFQFVSERITEWTGHSAASWLERPELFLQCVHEGDAPGLRQHLAQVAKSRAGGRARFRLRHAQSGQVTHISEFRRVVSATKRGPKVHEGFWLDETPLAQAQQRLDAASWAQILFRLTPGFAHDFNNVIAGVHGLSDTFLSQLEPGHPFREGLELVKKNTLQAAKLVQRLQQLHHVRPGERSYHDLNALTLDAAELLRRGFSKRYEIIAEAAPGQLAIHADTAALLHAILALAIHALDAMPEHGRLILRTRAHAQPPKVPAGGASLSGPCVCLSVIDLKRSLTPSESTELLDSKLRHAARILEGQGGFLCVKSKRGDGTSLQLWLRQADFTEGR